MIRFDFFFDIVYNKHIHQQQTGDKDEKTNDFDGFYDFFNGCNGK